ncbi:hypothetical protein DPMN_063619 [Dreissena polymorpha]|uniref:Uncharacterized protein n=1 Tax=Dreissena polymorpha TaxID=45954 RepID=A0A9D4CBA2_DREPO|nr:hypothetical protein DPMN_063619 [Dreissena polymorpha]
MAMCKQHKTRTACEELAVCSGFMLYFAAHQYLRVGYKPSKFESMSDKSIARSAGLQNFLIGLLKISSSRPPGYYKSIRAKFSGPNRDSPLKMSGHLTKKQDT